MASWLGAGIVNTTLGTPLVDPGGLGADRGELTSQGSSRLASPDDYEYTADVLREIADFAADRGVALSIEVHQHTIADNSRSALHLLDLIDHPNVGLNPDVGNIYWTYAEPEETPEAAILALAPHTNYWHCKNVQRVYFPELEHAIYLHAPAAGRRAGLPLCDQGNGRGGLRRLPGYRRRAPRRPNPQGRAGRGLCAHAARRTRRIRRLDTVRFRHDKSCRAVLDRRAAQQGLL